MNLWKQWKQWQTIFLGFKITANGDLSHEIKRCLLLGRKAMTNIDNILKSRDITLLTKVHLDGQSDGFSSNHVWMRELDHKESWVLKNWCFWTVVLEKTLECPMDNKEIQPIHPKGNQSWIFTGRTNAEAEAPWPPDEKSWLIWKEPDAGKDWMQEEKETTEDELVAWNHWLEGYEFEQALGVGDGQGSPVCCSPWTKSQTWLSDWTELNWWTCGVVLKERLVAVAVSQNHRNKYKRHPLCGKPSQLEVIIGRKSSGPLYLVHATAAKLRSQDSHSERKYCPCCGHVIWY